MHNVNVQQSIFLNLKIINNVVWLLEWWIDTQWLSTWLLYSHLPTGLKNLQTTDFGIQSQFSKYMKSQRID